MSKDVIRLSIPDVSGFSKALRKALPEAPGQVEMLNHIARAAGFRNFQHLRQRHGPEPEINHKKVARALRYFDEAGAWMSWPGKREVRELCLWIIWARLPPRTRWTEREISSVIDEFTVFRDAAQIRRSLVEMQLLQRNRDGSHYTRLETKMSADALELLREMKARLNSRDPQKSADVAFAFLHRDA